MKIKQKILYSFMLIVLLMGITGLGSYYLLNEMKAKLFPVTVANEKIISTMLQMRRNEKDFLLRSVSDPNFFKSGESKYLTKFKSNFAVMASKENTVSDFLGANSHGEEITHLLENYRSGFLAVVAEIKKRGYKNWGLEGSLREDVHALEAKVTEEKDLVNLLRLRRHEKDYFLRNDVKYFDKAKAVAKTLKANLSSASSRKLVSAYINKLNQIVMIDEKIGRTPELGVKGEYRNTIHKLKPLVEKQNKQLSAQVSDTVNKSLLFILMGVLFAAVVATVLALKLSKSIATPLMKMSEAGNKVAGGELDAVVPVIDTKDEVHEIGETMKLLIGALKFHKTKNY